MKASMVKYRILIRIYLKNYCQYPMRLFLKLIYLPVQMMMYLFLWINIGKSHNLDIKYMIAYYLIIGLLTNAYPFRHIALDVEEDVVEGSIANCLVRPYSYIVPAFSKYTAWSLIYSIVFIPTIIFVTFFRGVTAVQVLYFIIATIIGKSIEFMLWYNIGLVALFIERIRGVIITVGAVMTFMSGNIIPLSFFPKWFENITYFFPFRMYVYFPTDILLSERSIHYFLFNIFIALLWLILLIILSKILWKRGIGRLQGNIS